MHAAIAGISGARHARGRGFQRGLKLQGCENGDFMGGCLFDNVKPDMTSYKDEIFGPVLSVVRDGRCGSSGVIAHHTAQKLDTARSRRTAHPLHRAPRFYDRDDLDDRLSVGDNWQQGRSTRQPVRGQSVAYNSAVTVLLLAGVWMGLVSERSGYRSRRQGEWGGSGEITRMGPRAVRVESRAPA